MINKTIPLEEEDLEKIKKLAKLKGLRPTQYARMILVEHLNEVQIA